MDMGHWDTRACHLLVEPREQPPLQGLGSKRPKTLEMEQREPSPGFNSMWAADLSLQLGVRTRVSEPGTWSRSYSVRLSGVCGGVQSVFGVGFIEHTSKPTPNP